MTSGQIFRWSIILLNYRWSCGYLLLAEVTMTSGQIFRWSIILLNYRWSCGYLLLAEVTMTSEQIFCWSIIHQSYRQNCGYLLLAEVTMTSEQIFLISRYCHQYWVGLTQATVITEFSIRWKLVLTSGTAQHKPTFFFFLRHSKEKKIACQQYSPNT